jgi:phospholipid-binding lipoprotein MlaA
MAKHGGRPLIAPSPTPLVLPQPAGPDGVRARQCRSLPLPCFGVLLFLLAGCATPPPASDPEALAEYRANNDPLEPANRLVHAINERLDRAVARPVAVGYREHIPRPVRRGVRNALNNLRSPVILVNDMLQGEPRRAGDTLGRFLLNTTVGLGGIFDVAEGWFGVPRHTEDFGQTLAVWGMGEGPYLFLPLAGPTTLRDLAGSGVDGAANIAALLGPGAAASGFRYARTGMGLVDTREALIDPVDEMRRSSLDPYATYRSAYRQRRQADIENRLGPTVTSSTGAFLPTPERER